MPQRSTIIIGAGLAGLSAGCYARMNGYPARIFEHHSVPGGVAATWKRGDYTIDGGVHFLMGHKPGQSTYDLYRELGILPDCPVSDLRTYGRYVDEPTGRSIDITPDLPCLAQQLKAISPSDSQAIDELIAGAQAMRGQDLGAMGMSKPPEMTGFVDHLQLLWRSRGVLKYLSGKWAKPVSDYVGEVQHPCLRRFIENLFLPEVPVWFVLMLLAFLADGQLGLLEEGSLVFARAIEKRYVDLGGEVAYNATVTRILIEDGRAVGVQLADGTEHRADVIISAADGYSTIFEMLGGRYIDGRIRDRYENWPLFRPMVAVSFGVAAEYPDEPHLAMISLDRPLAAGAPAGDSLWVRILNYSACFAPPGKTVIQAAFESDWDFWRGLRQDRPRYEAEKQATADEVIERLQRHYPGISSNVEMTDVATPYTTWRYTLNQRGAFEGWLPTPKAIIARISRTLPGLSNFYMAGQWVMPGGGVPPCLYSGRQAIQLVCRADGKSFAVSVSS